MTVKKLTSKDFGVKLGLLKVEAGSLGLWETLHALDEVTKSYVTDVTRIQSAIRLNERKKTSGHKGIKRLIK